MPRQGRVAPDGFIHHVFNRGDHRETIFHKPADFRAFLALVTQAETHIAMRILAYCVMRNHFHFVLWPYEGKDLSAYMQWLMNAHIQRYLAHYPPSSRGHIYQGRYTNSLVQGDRHVLTVMRYVEANPVTGGIVSRAEDYKWSSASKDSGAPGRPPLTEGPIAKPADWLDFVNAPFSARELTRIQQSMRRGSPFGSEAWVKQVAAEHDLQHTLRPRGRPRLYETIDDAAELNESASRCS